VALRTGTGAKRVGRDLRRGGGAWLGRFTPPSRGLWGSRAALAIGFSPGVVVMDGDEGEGLSSDLLMRWMPSGYRGRGTIGRLAPRGVCAPQAGSTPPLGGYRRGGVGTGHWGPEVGTQLVGALWIAWVIALVGKTLVLPPKDCGFADGPAPCRKNRDSQERGHYAHGAQSLQTLGVA